MESAAIPTVSWRSAPGGWRPRGHAAGIPHERWGERPKAFVTLNSEASASADEIIAFCRERLAHYKCPDTIEFGSLPKTSTGKVQKFVLREREWGERATRIGTT